MFESPLSPPTDPKYVQFLSGLKEITDNEGIRALWRWDHNEGQWYAWAPDKWVLEDVGLADTPPGTALMDKSFGLGNPNWDLLEFTVPDLFKRVSAAHLSYKARAPKLRLVWGPWGGGDWRSAWQRPKGPPVPPVGPAPPVGSFPEECRKRIEWIRDAERRGLIVHDVAQRMVNDIVAECT